MKAKELKELGVEELKAKLAEQRQELFNLRFQHTTAQLEKTSSIPAARKNIARILTVLKEKEKHHVSSHGKPQGPHAYRYRGQRQERQDHRRSR